MKLKVVFCICAVISMDERRADGYVEFQKWFATTAVGKQGKKWGDYAEFQRCKEKWFATTAVGKQRKKWGDANRALKLEIGMTYCYIEIEQFIMSCKSGSKQLKLEDNGRNGAMQKGLWGWKRVCHIFTLR
jgi:hypothetical protein